MELVGDGGALASRRVAESPIWNKDWQSASLLGPDLLSILARDARSKGDQERPCRVGIVGGDRILGIELREGDEILMPIHPDYTEMAAGALFLTSLRQDTSLCIK
jgi:hypothetical protein